METRRVYRGIEEASLRPLPDEEHPHSGISRALRYRFRELRDVLEIRKTSFVAISNILGNSRVKQSSAVDAFKNSYNNVFAAIPYMTTSKKEKSRAISNDLELYAQLKRSISKETAKKEYDKTVSATKKEIRVLGGSEKPRERRSIKRIESAKN